ncbi:hypothetical protein SAMN02745704_01609 [Paucidesulfovibrio gracilis DSM 16080]|uniref:Uncharacterized protein n=1 Tax=Paucidesulfovibrio gracilis DSM 16080 TaxID=1121449 RepID=A0A1T4X0Y0_9BACT|nr:hypothetical protein [Paucidesulfovibrio gracilis]SKA83244.1 hypothetical protein SAMN02745704_01609 [Paucidesulfovibrio gracilis DSM 16080]
MVTSIKWDPAAPLPGAEPQRTTLRPDRGPSVTSEVSQRYSQSRNELTLRREAPALAQSLEERIQRLARAVEHFAWPENFPDQTSDPAKARTVQNGMGAPLVSAWLPDRAAPYDRYFSKGFDWQANAADTLGLDPGEYSFTLEHQDETSELTVTLDADMTMPDLLDAVALAVNNDDRNVQARQVSQTSPGLHAPGQVATGRSLAVSVNPAYGAELPVLRDTSGHLLAALDLRENPRIPSGNAPPVPARYSLQSLSRYSPTAFQSTAVDPGAAPPLEPGTHAFAYTHGSESGTFSMDVQADDTWEDVLQRFARTANASQSGFIAATVERERVSSAMPEGEWGDLRGSGLALEMVATAPKLGQRLQIAGDEDAEDDSGQAAATFLDILGLNASARPGTDARLAVDGRERERAPGVFALDQGRVRLEETGSVGSGELHVQEAYASMVEQLQDVTLAYNDLREFLLRDAELFQPGLAATWRAPLQALDNSAQAMNLNGTATPQPDVSGSTSGLERLGLREFGTDKLLWFDHDAFFTGLGSDPKQVRSLLLDAGQGLLPAWADLAARTDPRSALADHAESRPGAAWTVTEQSGLPDPFQPDLTPRTEVQLEQQSTLVNLLDDMGSDPFDLPSGRKIVDRSG